MPKTSQAADGSLDDLATSAEEGGGEEGTAEASSGDLDYCRPRRLVGLADLELTYLVSSC
jgi:hypothetical protein